MNLTSKQKDAIVLITMIISFIIGLLVFLLTTSILAYLIPIVFSSIPVILFSEKEKDSEKGKDQSKDSHN